MIEVAADKGGAATIPGRETRHLEKSRRQLDVRTANAMALAPEMPGFYFREPPSLLVAAWSWVETATT